MRITAMAGRRARVVTTHFEKKKIYALLPIILAARAGVSGMYPFGISAFAALSPTYFGATAVSLGALTLGASSVKYILTAICYLTFSYIKKLDRIANTMLIAFLAAVFGLFQMLFVSPSLFETLMILIESMATGLIYYIMSALDGKNKPNTREKQLARLLALGAAASGFSGIEIGTMVHLNIAVGFLLSMFITSSLSLTQSVTASIIIGLISVIDTPSAMSIVCVFALSSLFASSLREMSKWGTGLGYVCGSALVSVLGGNIYDVRIYSLSLLVAIATYLILPDFVHSWVQDTVRKTSGLYETSEEYKRVAKRIKTVTKQHREISTVLKHINEEIEREEEANIKETLYSVTSVIVQRAAGGGNISGDSFVEFAADNDRYCAILCDGMGAGAKAYRESKMTAELLKEFIMTGFLRDKAVGMLNTALAIKGDDESFSTVDLFEFNKTSGDAEFLKIGSAETFIKHKDDVDTLSCSSLPVGILDDVRSNTESRRLFAGDVVVMVSDGIGEAGYGVLKGEWIKRMIKASNSDIKRLADDILQEAVKRCYPEKDDDMTVAVIRIDRSRDIAE